MKYLMSTFQNRRNFLIPIILFHTNIKLSKYFKWTNSFYLNIMKMTWWWVSISNIIDTNLHIIMNERGQMMWFDSVGGGMVIMVFNIFTPPKNCLKLNYSKPWNHVNWTVSYRQNSHLLSHPSNVHTPFGIWKQCK